MTYPGSGTTAMVISRADRCRAVELCREAALRFIEEEIVAIPAGIFVPMGICIADRTEIAIGFIGGAVRFLPLFVFLPGCSGGR